MLKEPSRSVRLFGTDDPVEEPRIMRAGPLVAEFEAGNLRYIKFHGIEMIRAISYIVRDKNWGTYNPRISNLKIDEASDHIAISYDAEAGNAGEILKYSAKIAGSVDGALRFEVVGTAVSDFLTNRTGFVVLHPIEGVSGAPATIEHTDGQKVETRFPLLIDPVQPMMNLRAITHEFAPGAKVRCLMEGDTFEMEDQRNWTDASYKTYVRPLALPWPYKIQKGETISQTISLSISGQMKSISISQSTQPVEINIGKEYGAAPSLGAALDPEDIDFILANLFVLKNIGVHYLICHYDPRRGHNRITLARQIDVARALGCELWLEALVTSVEEWENEISELGNSLNALGRPFSVVMLSPVSDLKCTLPGSIWPPCPPAKDMFVLARKVFGDVKLAGGMFSFFTELNRKHPPVDAMDLVSFTTSALVHASDDRSITESLEALPHIARSVSYLSKNLPWAVGPSAIGMRDNPYGASVIDNSRDIRQAMNRNDPRHRGILAAAFDIGYYAQMAYGGAKAIALGGLAGPFGTITDKTPWPKPYYDQARGLYPVYHSRRALAQLKEAQLLEVTSAVPRDIIGIAAKTLDELIVLLANCTGRQQQVSVSGLSQKVQMTILNADNFSVAAHNPDFLKQSQDANIDNIVLDSHSFACLRQYN